MTFGDAVRHGFEPGDAHEILLDVCGDCFANRPAPLSICKEHQQVAQKWAAKTCESHCANW